MEHYVQLSGSLLDAWTYTPAVLAIIGTTGNTLSLITFCNKRCRKSSFTIYLSALAIVDTLVLVTALTHSWLFRVFRPDLNRYGTVSCKLIIFLTYALSQFSSWLVVVVTIQRTLCTFFMRHVKGIKTIMFGCFVVGAICLSLFGLNSHVFYGITYTYHYNNTFCGFIDDSYGDFFVNYYLWIDSTIYFTLPIVLIIVGNTATVVGVYRIKRAVVRTSSTGNLIESQMNRHSRHVLFITLLVSAAFIAFVSPASLWLALKPYFFQNTQFSQSFNVQEQTAEIIVYMLYCFNYAVNFFLYVLSGSRFRQDLKSAVCGSERLQTETQNEMGNNRTCSEMSGHISLSRIL